jgi:4-hydroxy-3-methylbut-2-enyl diphosphate reductase
VSLQKNNKVQVTVDSGSGFCFGVKGAVQAAETELQQHGTCLILGDIVHNEAELQRLIRMGLKVIGYDEFTRLHDARVMIRAHGEPPSTYETAERNRIELIDATCPVVLKLQRDVARTWESISREGGQLVIFGKEGHPEVRGLDGQTGGRAVVLSEESGIDRIDATRPVVLYSQTTMNLERFHAFAARLREAVIAATGSDAGFRMFDTVCRQVSHREAKLRHFAASHDVIIFVSGRKSSNGKALYEACREVNFNTHMVSAPEELEGVWFTNCPSTGVCGATSTPRWLMDEVAETIRINYGQGCT